MRQPTKTFMDWGIVFFMLFWSCIACDEMPPDLMFQDPALKACYDVTNDSYEDHITLENYTYLDCSGSGVHSLSGIDRLFALRNVHLNDNMVADVSPLALLSHLQTLHMARNQIDDVAPLSKRRSLRALVIPENNVTDLSALASLPNIIGLDVSYNQVQDGVAELAGMPSLVTLNLSGNAEVPCDDVEIIKTSRSDIALTYNGCMPAAPESIVVSDFVIDEEMAASFTMAWSEVAGARRYYVSWSDGPDDTGSFFLQYDPVEETRVAHREYLDAAYAQGLTEASTFYFQVTAESDTCDAPELQYQECHVQTGPAGQTTARPTISEWPSS